MKIGGLGAVHAMMGSPQQPSPEKRLGSFAGVLASFKNDMDAENGMAKETGTGLSSEELTELVEFLHTIDLSELEGGPELMEQVQTSAGENVFELILQYLGMDEKKWSALVDQIRSLATDAEGQQQASARKLDRTEDEIAVFNQLASLLSMVVAILSRGDHSLTKDAADAAKAAKLYDLLSNHDDSFHGKHDLHPLVKQVEEKQSLDFAAQQNGSKIQFLRKTFIPFVADLNGVERVSESQNNGGTVLSLNQTAKTGHPALILDQSGKHDLHLFVNQVAEKLESIDFAAQQNGSKMEYLRKTFAPLAEQLHHNRESLLRESESESNSNFSIKQDVNGTAFSLHQMPKAEQLALMLDKTGKPVSTEQFIQQFESILAKSRFIKNGGTQKLFLKLYPEHLGSVRIELIQKDQTIVARILTTTGAAKEALESHLQGLKHAFSSQNIQVERIEISQQMTEQERFFNRDSQQERQERHQEKHQQNKDQENTKEGALSFEQVLLDTEV